MSFLKGIFATKAFVGGVDIGSSTIKMVQLNKTPTGCELLKVAIGNTPSMAIKDGVIIDSQLIVDAIKQLMENNKVSITKVFSAVSGQSVVMRPINMAQMSEKELQNAIKFEAERYLPYSVSEAIIRGTILRKNVEGGDKNVMEVLLVAAPVDLVKKATDTLKMIGLQIAAVDLEPFALLRSLQNSVDVDSFNKTIALINLGAVTSSINIFKAGVLRHNRTISIAGNNFTKAIGQALNLSFDEAEKIKKEKGAIRLESDAAPVAPTTMRIFNVIATVLSELATEIQRSFDYYRSRYRGESVDLIMLSGGTAKFKNIDGFISKELGIPCEVVNPLKNISIKEGNGISSEEVQKMAPDLMVALGLALRDFIKI